MYAKDYHDLGTPAAKGESVTLEVDGATRNRAGGHVRHAGRGARGSRHPEALRHGHAEGLRLLPRLPGRDRGSQGIPGFVHHGSGGGHEGAHAERSADKNASWCPRAVRLGASDGQLPGGEPLRSRASRRGARHSRLALRERRRRARPKYAEAGGSQQPIFPVRQRPVHRLFALRPGLRGHAGYLRADHRRPWPRVARRRVPAGAVPGIRMCVLRRLRRGVPHGRADGEERHHRGTAAGSGRHHLRLLRRGLLPGRRGHRWRGRAHGSQPRRPRKPGSRLREGPLRIRLRHPHGSRDEAADPLVASPTSGPR